MSDVTLQPKRVVVPERVARQAVSLGEVGRPLQPGIFRVAVGHADEIVFLERIFPGRDPAIGIPVEFLVTLPQKPERVFVKAEPDVQPVLFDAVGGTAARRALAAQPPAELIDGDVEAALVFGAAELERGGHGGAAATDHGDLDCRLFGRLPVVVSQNA